MSHFLSLLFIFSRKPQVFQKFCQFPLASLLSQSSCRMTNSSYDSFLSSPTGVETRTSCSRVAIPGKLSSGSVTVSEIDGERICGGIGSMEICVGCRQRICDRYIMRVMDHSWHESCLQCSVCRIILTKTCYSRDCKLYCKTDYDK